MRSAYSVVCGICGLLGCGGGGDAGGGPAEAEASMGVGDATADGNLLVAAADGGPIFLGDAATAACSRTATLPVVGTDGGTAEPFDVIIVADNADGITFSNKDLASGLQTLLANVAGQSVRFFLLSTTQYGALSQTAVSQLTQASLVSWSSSVDGSADLDPVTAYSQACADSTGKSIPCPARFQNTQAYTVHGQWTFQMPPPVATIAPGMTPAQLAAQEQAVSSAVLDLKGGGSQEEQPVCTLARYITQTGYVFPKRAVFIVISDEDDTTPPKDCLATYDFSSMAAPPSITQVPCVGGGACDQYDYFVTAPATAATVAYTCVPQDDKGNTYPSLGKAHSFPVGAVGIDCSNPACPSDDLTFAVQNCGTGFVVQNCTLSCTGATTTSCSLTRTSGTPYICNQSFQEKGVTYNNLADYCAKTFPPLPDGGTWGNCMESSFDLVDGGSSGYSGQESLVPVFPAPDTSYMITRFKDLATQTFGAAGYRVETIQLDPSFSCPIGPGQSYAPTLRTLATTNADVFPLCGSYAGALQQVQTFAQGIEDTFGLALGPRDSITGVTVQSSDGSMRALSSGQYSYDAASGVLSIGAGVLSASDTGIAVTIAASCPADGSFTH